MSKRISGEKGQPVAPVPPPHCFGNGGCCPRCPRGSGAPASAVCNATIPTLPLFEMSEFACSLRFTLSFVYKVYIGFLSRMRDWTVAVAQYSKFAC
jgi:hypothetical protein